MGQIENKLKDILEVLKSGGCGGGLPPVTDADNDKILLVNNGAWAAGGRPSWSQTVDLPLQLQNDQQFMEDPSFIKCSDSVLTTEQLIGAVMTVRGSGSVTITSEMLKDLQQEMGVNATAIVVPDYGTVFIVAYSADTPIPSTGLYISSNYSIAVEFQALTFTYPDTVTAKMRPIVIGTAELEDGVSDLPPGVIYFQLEKTEEEES